MKKRKPARTARPRSKSIKTYRTRSAAKKQTPKNGRRKPQEAPMTAQHITEALGIPQAPGQTEAPELVSPRAPFETTDGYTHTVDEDPAPPSPDGE